MPEILIQGIYYPLATTLRVAYKIQGQHNHKPYAEIFQSVGQLGVQEQIGFLYASFDSANPGRMTKQDFQDYLLDNFNLKGMIDLLQEIIAGMMGTDVSKLTSQAPVEANPQATEVVGTDPQQLRLSLGTTSLEQQRNVD